MILNTGQRTDIPAFYPKWFANRIKEGFVCVRNPYNPVQVSRYKIHPEVVDAIGFCTKNPEPFFPYLDLVKDYGQFWYVTMTSLIEWVLVSPTLLRASRGIPIYQRCKT